MRMGKCPCPQLKEPKAYYELLRKYFRKLKGKVTIAAHPSSKFDKHPEYVEEFEWRKGETEKLIKECDLVLAHDSKAIQWAIQYKKPIRFLTFKTFGWYMNRIKKTAEKYGEIPICMDIQE
jgi:hypothetical protein